MIKVTQFFDPNDNSLAIAGEMGLHIRNQGSEKLNALTTKFIRRHIRGGDTVFIEGLLLLYSLGKIRYNKTTDEIEYIR